MELFKYVTLLKDVRLRTAMPKKKPAEKKPNQDGQDKEAKEQKKSIENPIIASFDRQRVLAESSQEAQTVYDQSRFGEKKEGKFIYSLHEGLYLLEKKRMKIISERKELDIDTYVKKAQKIEPNFWLRYVVYRDMRSRGYIIKTALKFGADFRVYDRGVKPGEDHAKWILYPIYEADTLTWYEFSAKNRVAHSTRKKLLIGIVDDEDDVTYYQVGWTRP